MLAYFNSTLYLYKKRKIKLFGLDYSISSCLFSNPMLVMLVSYLQMRRNLAPSSSLRCKQEGLPRDPFSLVRTQNYIIYSSLDST